MRTGIVNLEMIGITSAAAAGGFSDGGGPDEHDDEEEEEEEDIIMRFFQQVDGDEGKGQGDGGTMRKKETKKPTGPRSYFQDLAL